MRSTSRIAAIPGGVVIFAFIAIAQTTTDPKSNQPGVPLACCTGGILVAFPEALAPASRSSASVEQQTMDAKRTPGFLKRFTVESFGLGTSPNPGYESSPGYTASFFNVSRFECPRCLPGMPNRTRFTIPPFGATATLHLLNDRVRIFSGVGGIQAFKPEGTFEPRGFQNWTSNYGDAWLTHAEAGLNFGLDKEGRLRLGASGSELLNFGADGKPWNNRQRFGQLPAKWLNFGAGKRRWSTVSAAATFTFGR